MVATSVAFGGGRTSRAANCGPTCGSYEINPPQEHILNNTLKEREEVPVSQMQGWIAGVKFSERILEQIVDIPVRQSRKKCWR